MFSACFFPHSVWPHARHVQDARSCLLLPYGYMHQRDETGDTETGGTETGDDETGRERLSYRGLMRAARRAMQESGARQVDLADQLGVSQGGLSRALSTPGPKFARLQQRVVEHLTPYVVEKKVRFILRPQPKTDE